MHDVIIIGGGPAAMTAAVYAARKKMDLVLIAAEIGGQAMWAPEVDNYLGYRIISGYDLVQKFEEHVRDYGVTTVPEKVTSLRKTGDAFEVKTDGGKELSSRAVIVATGRVARSLGIPGEEEYRGKGVAYCATCDAPLFAGEDVAVVGGGNVGLESAIPLTKIAGKVYLIEEGPKMTGDQKLQDHLLSASNAEVLTRTRIVRIDGDQFVNSITIRNLDTGEERQLPSAGIFIEVGSAPSVSFLPSDVQINENGEVVIDSMNRTTVEGLFAAGDVTSIPAKQIIIAAGEGAKALLSAYRYIVNNFPRGG
jgi:NADH-dependent peroxiredoxin subunit F